MMPENTSSNKESIIVYMTAAGKKPSEIAETLGCAPLTVKKCLETDRIQFEVKKMRHKLFGSDVQKKFKDMLPKAQEVAEEILGNPNTKEKLRFTVAQEVFDRALGKPKQTVELQGSLVKGIYEKLDKFDSTRVLEISPGGDILESETVQNPNETTKLVKATNPNLAVDPIDAWANEHL